MKRYVILLLSLCLFAAGAQGKTLLEKKLFFMNPETKKIDSVSYWKIYLGNYPLMLKEDAFDTIALPYQADANLTLFSSGYIDGSGYGKNGKISCIGNFATDSCGKIIRLNFDSIDYINKNGAFVRYSHQPTTAVFVDIENNRVLLRKKMMLTKYLSSGSDELRNLKSTGDVPVSLFAFSKAAYFEAVKAEIDTSTKQ
jgi:hypothetical protein